MSDYDASHNAAALIVQLRHAANAGTGGVDWTGNAGLFAVAAEVIEQLITPEPVETVRGCMVGLGHPESPPEVLDVSWPADPDGDDSRDDEVLL